VVPLDENQKVIEVSIPDKCAVKSNGTTVGIKDSCKWTKDDPFLVRPLLPFALNVTPKTDELVMLVYPIAQNSHSTFKRYTDNFKYYVPMSPTTPNRAGFENYNVTKSNTPLGDNIKQSKSYKEVGGVIPKSIFGLFPEPNDNAILGRGSTDIILKEDDLLLRAGKTLNLVPSDSGQPSVYDKRAFLQMSVFKSRTVIERAQQTEKLSTQYPNLSYLIEWNIVNPENEQNAFRTNVRVYEIKSNDEKINTKNFKVDTDIKTIIDSSKIVKQLDTGPDSFDNTITQINNFLNEWNNAKFEYGGKSAFPFAFRPARPLFLKWTDTNNLNSAGPELIEGINISKFYNNKSLWKGCFGTMTVINYDFLQILEHKYKISNLVKYITCRKDRMALERVFGCLFTKGNLNYAAATNTSDSATATGTSMLGNIHQYCCVGQYYQWYIENRIHDDPMIKLWSNR
jgi:hypothetical protein